jgi:beta-glucosidase
MDATPEVERRVDLLLTKMSLDDKLSLIGGTDSFYTQAIPSIGLSRFKMTDGPVGTRTFGPSTAFTAGVALSATWDPVLAHTVGAALGEDARARGVHFLLAPGVNIYRSPLNGRNMEYLGEDPYLAGRIAVGIISGVQSKGVSATVKHFAANNSEFDRHRINSVIDERTLREIYLPSFEAAVKSGDVGAVMDSYNLVNGAHSTQNDHLNLDILKGEWNFQGVVMSDWVATYDAVAAANAGLDLEMPYAKLMNAKAIKEGLDSGKISIQTINDKVRRILRTAIRFGWLDRDQWDTTIPLDNPFSRNAALEEARESITLLKNEGALLPLDAKKVHSIVLVGPMASSPVVGGGGSSNTTPFGADSFVVGFSRYLAGSVKVLYAPFMAEPSQLARSTHFNNLKMEVTSGTKRTDPVAAVQSLTGDSIDLLGNRGDEESLSDQSVPARYVWTGEYKAAKASTHLVMAVANDADTYSIKINGTEILKHQAIEGCLNDHEVSDHEAIRISPQEATRVEVVYQTRSEHPHFGVAILPEDEILSPQSRKMIEEADAAVVSVGFGPACESEGFDRTYALPGVQNELIREVAALNKKTIVTISAGGSVETKPWISKVPAVLDLYYPGQEGARALAEIVFGERSPEGRLPFSWETVLSENPASSHYFEEPGDNRTVHYSEGLMLGYRYYTTKNKQPLFPFGFGLSYSHFSFSHLMLNRISDDDVEVSFDVRNDGYREAATVAQVYVGDPSAKVDRPVRELKQFTKVRLAAGETKRETLHLNRRAFQYFDVSSSAWHMDPGEFTVMVGESSETIRLKQSIDLR